MSNNDMGMVYEAGKNRIDFPNSRVISIFDVTMRLINKFYFRSNSIADGFSRKLFHKFENLAMVAPSIIR